MYPLSSLITLLLSPLGKDPAYLDPGSSSTLIQLINACTRPLSGTPTGFCLHIRISPTAPEWLWKRDNRRLMWST